MKRDPRPSNRKRTATVELKVVKIGKKDQRLTWVKTYRETAREKEDWNDLDATLADGIEPGEKIREATLL